MLKNAFAKKALALGLQFTAFMRSRKFLDIPNEIELAEDLASCMRVGTGSEIERAHVTLRRRVVDADFLGAESLMLAIPETPSLEKIRTWIARGELESAEKSLAAWLECEIPDLLRAEASLELARVRLMEGNWIEVVRHASSALEIPVFPSVSRLAAIQIRALSWLELGELSKTAADLDRARSLLLLFPNAPTAFYVEAIEARYRLASGRIEAAKAKIGELHARCRKRESFNFDRLLTLARLESTDRAAYLGVLLSRAIGDSLYEGLGWAELAGSVNPVVRERSLGKFREFSDRFSRVRSFPIVDRSGEERGNSRDPGLEEALGNPPSSVLWVDRGLLVDLEAKEIRVVELSEQHRLLLDAIRSTNRSESAIFRSAWKLSYRPDSHLSTLKVALKRLRDRTGLAFSLRGGEVSIPAGVALL